MEAPRLSTAWIPLGYMLKRVRSVPDWLPATEVADICAVSGCISEPAKADPVAKRLMTIPGVGPVVATALAALAPPASTFRRGRDFAAWLGLTPKQHSSGGKERLGRTSKMGERSLRRLLILGASSAAKAAARDGSRASSPACGQGSACW